MGHARDGLGLTVVARALEAIAVALSLYGLVLLLWIAGRRCGYGYDLEWMEGGELTTALRVLHHQTAYPPPSVDFIPYTYMPLYPALVAAIGAVTGDVTYAAGRAVSITAFLGALTLAAWLCAAAVRPVGSSWRARLPIALAALGLPVLGYDVVGGWYDLCRVDSLQIFLTIAGLAAAWRWQSSPIRVLAAAPLLVLAFFTKQSALPVAAAGGLVLLAMFPRSGAALALAGVAMAAAGIFAMDRSTSGWFSFYVFHVYPAHTLDVGRGFVTAPLRLARSLGVAALLVPYALWRHRGPEGRGLRYAAALGAGGVAATCVAAWSQYSHLNSYVPGIFFSSIAIGAAAGLLASGPAWQRACVATAMVASLAPRLYSPSRHLPPAGATAEGAALVARLRDAPGEVLVPFHPFYAHLAGKQTYLHRQGLWDLRGTSSGPVRGLAEAIAERRFSLIVFDRKVEQTWGDWPDVLAHYRIVDRFEGPPTVEGAHTQPALALEPIR